MGKLAEIQGRESGLLDRRLLMTEREQEPQAPASKVWMTPTLTVHGDAARLTQGGIPPKVYGNGDGAIWNQQQVTWGS